MPGSAFGKGPEGPIPSKPAANSAETNPAETSATAPNVAASSTKTYRGSIPPFWLKSTSPEATTRALTLPPVFVDRRPNAGNETKFFHADLALTFGWYSEKIERRRFINPLGLYIGSFSKKGSSWFTLPLLMGYRRVDDKYNFVQFPLVWAWGNQDQKNTLVLPFYFRRKEASASTGTALLFAWFGDRNLHDADPANDLRYKVVFPLYAGVQTHARSLHLSPVWVAGKHRFRGNKHRTLFPLFHWHEREFGNRSVFFSPIWLSHHDKARQVNGWAVWPLATFHRENSRRELTAITPLAWFGKSKQFNGSFWNILNTGHQQDVRQSASWFAPFYFALEDKLHGAKGRFVLPLGWHTKTREESRTHTLLFSHVKREANGGFTGIHPLLSYVGTRDNVQRGFLLGGLAWWKRAPQIPSSFGIGPLFYRTRGKDSSSFGLLPTLTFTGKTPTKSYQVVTPFFWHVRENTKESQKNTVVAGPFYHQKSNSGWAAGAAPLVFAAHNEKQSFAIVPPLLAGYHRDNVRQQWRFISPLAAAAGSNDAATFGALAVAWHVRRGNETHQALFPLLYRYQSPQRDVFVSPVFSSWRRGEQRNWFAGPIFGGKSPTHRQFGIFPLVAFHRADASHDVKKLSLVAPFYLQADSNEGSREFFSPLLFRSRLRDEDGGAEKHRFGALPFYVRQRQENGTAVDIAPGFVWSRTPSRQTHTLIAGPFFHRLSRDHLLTGVAPFVWWRDSITERMLLVPPLILHKENKVEESYTTVALPLWFDRQTGPYNRTWAAFPFAAGKARRNGFVRFSMVPPGFVDSFRVDKNRRVTGFLPLVFRWQKCGFIESDDPKCRYTGFAALPFFAIAKDGLGRRSHSALSLYWFDRDKDGFRLYSWLFGGEYTPANKMMWYAGPVVRSVTRTHETTAVLPLFLHRKHRSRDIKTTLVVPPLYIGQHKEDRRWFEAGLVAWQFRTPHRVTTLVAPPLFGHRHTFAERKTTWLAPLFVHDNHLANDSHFTGIFPVLFFHHDEAKHSQTDIQFPLYWHFRRGQSNSHVVAGLYYDIKRATKHTRILPGVFFQRDNLKEKRTVIGPGLAWWWKDKVKADGTRHWRALLGIFGGGNESGRPYAHLFGGRIWGSQKNPQPSNSSPTASATKSVTKSSVTKPPVPALPSAQGQSSSK